MLKSPKIGLLMLVLAFILPTLSEASGRGSPPKTIVLSPIMEHLDFIYSFTNATAETKDQDNLILNHLTSVRPGNSLYSKRSTESILAKNDVGWQNYNESYISKLTGTSKVTLSY